MSCTVVEQGNFPFWGFWEDGEEGKADGKGEREGKGVGLVVYDDALCNYWGIQSQKGQLLWKLFHIAAL